MVEEFYRLEMEGFVSYSIYLQDSSVELTTHFRHGDPEHIVYYYSKRVFTNYRGSGEKKSLIGKDELKYEFLSGLEFFIKFPDKIRPHIDFSNKEKLVQKIEDLIEEIRWIRLNG